MSRNGDKHNVTQLLSIDRSILVIFNVNVSASPESHSFFKLNLLTDEHP
jgi:hypothetical protein